jgi:tRNA threonylcarbamoyladenosine biosynthesis protein TsaB
MIILTIRTDKPEAEIGIYNDKTQLTYETWQAHRQLAETVHLKIKATLEAQQLDLRMIKGIVVFQGPGSFTGLRIGISVANALADGLGIAIVGAQGEDWASDGITRLTAADNDRIVLPEYGALPNVSTPKKLKK